MAGDLPAPFGFGRRPRGPARARVWAIRFPNRRIDFVVPLPPGGPNDSAVRLLTAYMGPLLNVPLVTLNKPGAGGAVAAAYVANANPDGYTVLATSNSVLSINLALQKDLTYRMSDFTPIGMFAADIGAIVSRRDQPWTNLEDFVTYARAHPNTLSYGSAGIGTVSHFAAELFKLSYGIDVVHVPYQGTGPAKAAIIGARCRSRRWGFGLRGSRPHPAM
ncbi:MAG: tripartite tricarboxylate transporter substrate binding protein [Pseudomonadota bacterium]